MGLPESDAAFLADRGIVHEVSDEGGMTNLIFPEWPLPTGYDRDASTLLLRLQPGYPDVPPDMWWFDPPVLRADGSGIPGTDLTEPHLGRSWQRWSRHFEPGQWQSGIDGLESFLALIRREIEQWALGVAA